VGSWYLNPGKDYYNGDHLKQELMVCPILSC
jgi:rhamnogalacturonan endolyase